MNRPEDEKLEELGLEISKHRAGSTGRMCAQARYWGFVDGCAHVRTSAEWRGMEKVVRKATEVVGSYALEFYTAAAMSDLWNELHELDRIRKEGESG